MIINIRGTSGCGKSTLVRQVMSLYKTKVRHMEEGRKQPIGYVLTHPDRDYIKDQETPLAVMGHYETACGGCDTINKHDHVLDLVRQADDLGYHVIFEGLLLSGEVHRMTSLQEEGRDFQVIGMDKVDIETCLASVNARRLARVGEEKFTPVKEANTVAKFRGTQLAMQRLRDAGVTVHSVDRKEGFQKLIEALQ